MKFKHITTVIKLNPFDIKALDEKLAICFASAKTISEFIKEADKIPQNEEEMKYVWFKLGQMEMLNYISHHLKKDINGFLEACRVRVGI